MKKAFIIQNAINKKYWYGFSSTKRWTDNILEAALFDSKHDAQDYIKTYTEFDSMIIFCIELLDNRI